MKCVNLFSSVESSAFLTPLAASWTKEGWSTSLNYELNEESYRLRTSLLGTLSKRWSMYAGAARNVFRSARHQLGENRIHVFTTNPFFAPALGAWACRDGTACVNWVLDLYPDVLIQNRTIRAGSFFERRMSRITTYAIRKCQVSVFLGERLRRGAMCKYGTTDRSMVVPLGADAAPFKTVHLSVTPRLVVGYIGYMGRMHDTSTIIEALRAGVATDMPFHFFASGRGYEELVARAKDYSGDIILGSGLRREEWKQAMRETNVALVTLANGAEAAVLPSKVYSAMAAGQAVIAICSTESDLADLVLKHDCGWVVRPGDVRGLIELVRHLRNAPQVVFAKRCNAYTAGHQIYDVAVLARRWADIFSTCGEGH